MECGLQRPQGDDLALRPIFHQLEELDRVRTSLYFIPGLLFARALARLFEAIGAGLTPRSVLEKVRGHADARRVSTNRRYWS